MKISWRLETLLSYLECEGLRRTTGLRLDHPHGTESHRCFHLINRKWAIIKMPDLQIVAKASQKNRAHSMKFEN